MQQWICLSGIMCGRFHCFPEDAKCSAWVSDICDIKETAYDLNGLMKGKIVDNDGLCKLVQYDDS